MSIQTNITNEQVDLYFSDLIRKVEQRFVSGVPDNISAAKQRAQWKDTYHEIGQILSVLSRSANGSIDKNESLSILNSLPDGIYEAKTSGTYPFGLIAKEGFYTRFSKQGTQWSLHAEIKSATLDGIIALGNSAGVTGGSIWNYLYSYGIFQYNDTYATNVGYGINQLVWSAGKIYRSKKNNNQDAVSVSASWEEATSSATVDLSDYALKSWVTQQILNVNTGGSVDLSAYALKDASGLTTANQNAWKTALGLDDLVTTNLYNANGTLTGNRNVSLNNFKLNFSGGITKVDTLELGKKTSNLLPNILFTNGTDVRFTDENGVTWTLLRKVDRVRWGKALTPIDEDITISSYRGMVVNERCKIKKFHITAGTPPTGSGIVVGMQKNLSTITTVNASILPNARTSASNSTQPTFSSDTFEVGDRIDFFIPAGGIGSVNAGQNLEVYLEFEIL